MCAQVLTGQLISVDTKKGRIELRDRADGEVTSLDIDAHTRFPASYGWERCIGKDVEAVVIDGKTKNVRRLAKA